MQPFQVIGTCLKGAIIAMSLHGLWDVVLGWSKAPLKKVAILKIIFTASLAAKGVFHATYNMPAYSLCNDLAKTSTALYHISMSAANWILLSRASLVLVSTPVGSTVMEYCLVVIRIAAGLADSIMSYSIYQPDDGSCLFLQNFLTGMFVACTDLFIDIYVTVAITGYLLNHSAKIQRKLGGVYAAIVSSNLLRTLILLIFNTATVIIGCLPYDASWQPIVWLATNIAYILTVAYDADMIKMMARIQMQWVVRDESFTQKAATPLVLVNENSQINYVTDDAIELNLPKIVARRVSF